MANNRTTTKAAYGALLADNTSRDITPEDHRDSNDEIVDNAAFLNDSNTFESTNDFQGLTRFETEALTGSGTVTISGSNLNNLIIPAGVTQVNWPASPANGDWYSLKNAAGANVTMSGNGNNFYTSADYSTRVVVAGGIFTARYNSSLGKWFVW